ncbi:hypothetical protein GGS20DRAFT_531736 [Poronia punctata]|nr:hypothetical protein GGS20DRAFT_531736 [Poronia punctata]
MLPPVSLALGLGLSLISSTSAATVSFLIPPSPQIPNPAALSPSTHATLTALGASYSAPLSTDNTFVFRNVSVGSYLADIYCSTYGFAPLRVDVDVEGDGQEELVRAWETFRGNDWDNRGEQISAVDNGGAFPVRVLGEKVYYTERSGFSILSILKNPMILMGLVSLGLFVGMPKLMENMDPEMRAEFEEQSRKSPMNSIMAGPQPGANPMGNFDVAGFLAGQNNQGGEAAASSSSSEPSNAGNGGKKGGKR